MFTKRTISNTKTYEAFLRLQKLILSSLDYNKVINDVVNAVFKELDFLNLGYEIAVLCLIDKQDRALKRISVSQTTKAKEALKVLPIPFHQIVIPLRHSKNLLIKSIKDKKPKSTTNWTEILTPSFTKDEAKKIQQHLGIKTSLIYPIAVEKSVLGTLILSMSKRGHQVSSQEKDIIRGFVDTVGLAVQNAALYSQVESANQQLKHANSQLRHLDKLKDEFVFIATHELKTPVTVMKGYLSMLKDGQFGQLPDPMKEPLGEIEAANQQLVQLVNDLLEIARSEAKRLQIKTESTQLCQVIDQVVQNVKPLADQKSLKLDHSCGPKGIQVMADPDRLKEILNNLVSNAIKYSEKGTITISHAIDSKYVVTHVTDQGYGISEADQKHIFTRFFRAEELANKAPGTGLGLFIVKQLIEKMGGRIWFKSELGVGTTFSFSLPRLQ